MWHLGTVVNCSGWYWAGLVIGLDNFRGLFQPQWLCDSFGFHICLCTITNFLYTNAFVYRSMCSFIITMKSKSNFINLTSTQPCLMDIKSFDCVSGFCSPCPCTGPLLWAQHKCVLQWQRGFSTTHQTRPVVPVHTVLFAQVCSAALILPPLLIRSSQDKFQLSFSVPEKVTKCGRKQQNTSSGNIEVRSKEKGLAEGLFRVYSLVKGGLWPILKCLSSLKHWSCNVKCDVPCLQTSVCNAQNWILSRFLP